MKFLGRVIDRWGRSDSIAVDTSVDLHERTISPLLLQ